MPTPTDVASMNAEFSQLCALIAEVIASPQPSYSENGRSVSKTEYLSALYERRSKLLTDIQNAAGPFTVYG